MNDNDKNILEVARAKVKSMTKRKLMFQRENNNLKNLESVLLYDLSTTHVEFQSLEEQLQELQNLISSARHQLSLIEICEISEKKKIQENIISLKKHETLFEELFAREQKTFEKQRKLAEEKEQESLEAEKQLNRHIIEKSEMLAKEVVDIENECGAIEQQCNVLKKKNNAIMLKLRKKLIETEDIRRKIQN